MAPVPTQALWAIIALFEQFDAGDAPVCEQELLFRKVLCDAEHIA